MSASQIDKLAQWIRNVNKQNGWNVTQDTDWPGMQPPTEEALAQVEDLVKTMQRHEKYSDEWLAWTAEIALHVPALLGLIYRLQEQVQMYKIPAILALIHSEVSEALEAFRVNDQQEFIKELADVDIRVLDCVAAFEPDFHKVLCDKIEYNRTRGHRHGNKRI